MAQESQKNAAQAVILSSTVGKWWPASVWKEKAGMVHSVSECAG